MTGYCPDCTTEEGRFWNLLDLDKTVEKWSNHVRNDTHLPPVDFMVYQITYQNGMLDNQFSLENVAGFSSISEVHNRILGVEEDDTLVLFNEEDMRDVPSEVYEKKAKVQDFTICEATFFRPPFPPEYLDKTLCPKVRSQTTYTY